MNQRHLLLLVAVGAVVGIPAAFAQGSTTMSAKLLGQDQIDLNSPLKDRVIRAYVSFTDFDLSDKYFTMKVIDKNTKQEVFESKIYVGSTKTDLVDFNSHVIYVIPNSWIEENKVYPGEFIMKISTVDRAQSEQIPFSIIDTRD